MSNSVCRKRRFLWELPTKKEFYVTAMVVTVLYLSGLYFLCGCTASFSLQKQNENSSVTIKTESSNHADSTRVTLNN